MGMLRARYRHASENFMCFPVASIFTFCFIITQLIKNVGIDNSDKAKKERDEKTEKALKAALERLKTFIGQTSQETIKFSTNAYIRAKLHDYCDETGGLSHESITKKGSRILIIKKLDFKPIEKEAT